MEEHISVSLIIPAYNTEKWIEDCLESAINQTNPFDEIIVIDDGSTDRTRTICEEYASRSSNIRVLHQENKGQGTARNWGIKEAKSNYIMFLDSDDCLETNTLEELKDNLDKDLDGILFDASIFGDNRFAPKKNVYERNRVIQPGVYCGRDFFERFYPNGFLASVCLAIYKKSLLEEKGIIFPEGVIYEDNVFSFEFIIEAERITYIPNKLYRRRYRENSTMTEAYDEFHMYSHIICADHIFRYINAMSEGEPQILLYAFSWGKTLLTNWSRFRNDNSISIDEKKSLDKRLSEALKMLVELLENKFISFNLEQDLFRLCLFQLLSAMNSLLESYPMDLAEMRKYTEIKLWAKQYFLNLFNSMSLNCATGKVGIYGVGKYTKGMMETYTKLYSEIPDVLFIDSYRAGTDFRGKTIKSLHEIGKLDVIYISVRGEESKNIKKRLEGENITDKVINLNEICPINQFVFYEFYEF
ncbi:glycosyltransferase family 2 protein [Butyrivibrio sp. MB2005]|uniref:glycosyltransferase family 2 protein n=1 Tax=Butyrivibrio sp. MB2005 TaxID=1280678 RepID=UPI00040F5865|nr:glycosyltransferase family 2 protein [Butyrivibrio sp. MB2005]